MSDRRRLRSWSAITLLVLTLVGCQGLPSTSPVQPGRAVDEQVGSSARMIVPPPDPGASQEQVVRGFLRAGAGFQEPGDNGEIVAKSYLAPESVARWVPTSLVTVFDNTTVVDVAPTGPDVVTAAITAVAVVDDTGHYRELPPGTRTDVRLRMVQIEGEWRIDLPASGFGIWLNTTDFDRIFRPYRLTYPVLGTRRLLADVRWWPVGPRIVTALARAQIAPPPDYLKPVVDTGFPETARLAVEAVAVQDGLATVVLTAPATSADLTHRRAIWAQLAATLLAVPDVTRIVVEVQASGRLAVPDLPDQVRALSETGYTWGNTSAPRTGYLRTGESLQRIDLARLGDLTQPSIPAGAASDLPVIPAGFAGLAAGPEGSGEFAAVSGDGRQLVRWRGKSRSVIDGVGVSLTRPTYDSQGWLWVAGGSDPPDAVGSLWVSGGGTPRAQRVAASWLQGRVPVAIAVSGDSTRIAIASLGADGTGPRVDIAGIGRDVGGMPTTLAMPMLVDAPLARTIALGWVDDLTLAVLGAVQLDEQPRVYTAELGQGIGLRRRGSADTRAGVVAPVPGARSVIGLRGLRDLVVQSEVVLVRVGNGWRPIGQASELAVSVLPQTMP